MNRLWNKVWVGGALGALVLAGATAWAQPKGMKLPPKAPRPANLSCTGHCKVDTKECLDMCDAFAKEAGAICTNGCFEMEKECNDECKPKGRQ